MTQVAASLLLFCIFISFSSSRPSAAVSLSKVWFWVGSGCGSACSSSVTSWPSQLSDDPFLILVISGIFCLHASTQYMKHSDGFLSRRFHVTVSSPCRVAPHSLACPPQGKFNAVIPLTPHLPPPHLERTSSTEPRVEWNHGHCTPLPMPCW